jgi:hypothetical protein
MCCLNCIKQNTRTVKVPILKAKKLLSCVLLELHQARCCTIKVLLQFSTGEALAISIKATYTSPKSVTDKEVAQSATPVSDCLSRLI